MSWLRLFTGKSESPFVRDEVLKRLPKSITIEFISEFDHEDNPIIFICSPEHDGLISEARTNSEAIENASDAILTYFDVPRSCANLIEFDVSDVSQRSFDLDVGCSIRVREFKLKQLVHA